LGGLPSRVTAITQTVGHRIEVEDRAMALLEYPNGASGYIYCSTTEAPTSEIVELSGEKGKLQIVNDQIRFWELPEGVKSFSDASPEMWAHPPEVQVDVPLPDAETGHGAILRNFARHLLYGEDLIAPGVQGLSTVEMINAVILSGGMGEPVDVPVDRARYDAFLDKLKASSTFVKDGGPDKRITDDVHH
jgi:predicted dehydrogenase